MERETGLWAGFLRLPDIECPDEHGNFDPECALCKRDTWTN